MWFRLVLTGLLVVALFSLVVLKEDSKIRPNKNWFYYACVVICLLGIILVMTGMFGIIWTYIPY